MIFFQYNNIYIEKLIINMGANKFQIVALSIKIFLFCLLVYYSSKCIRCTQSCYEKAKKIDYVLIAHISFSIIVFIAFFLYSSYIDENYVVPTKSDDEEELLFDLMLQFFGAIFMIIFGMISIVIIAFKKYKAGAIFTMVYSSIALTVSVIVLIYDIFTEPSSYLKHPK